MTKVEIIKRRTIKAIREDIKMLKIQGGKEKAVKYAEEVIEDLLHELPKIAREDL